MSARKTKTENRIPFTFLSAKRQACDERCRWKITKRLAIFDFSCHIGSLLLICMRVPCSALISIIIWNKTNTYNFVRIKYFSTFFHKRLYELLGCSTQCSCQIISLSISASRNCQLFYSRWFVALWQLWIWADMKISSSFGLGGGLSPKIFKYF